MIWPKRDGDFFNNVDKVAAFLLANFLWVALSITVLAIPFATVGLFAVMSAWVQGRQPELFRTFLGGIRDHWQKAVMIAAADVLVGGLLVLNLIIFPMMASNDLMAIFSRSITIFVGLVLLMANVYAWPLAVMTDLGINPLFKLVMTLVFSRPLRSAGITLLALLPLAAGVILPKAFLLFGLVSATAFLASYGTWLTLQKQFTADELQNLLLKTMSLKKEELS